MEYLVIFFVGMAGCFAALACSEFLRFLERESAAEEYMKRQVRGYEKLLALGTVEPRAALPLRVKIDTDPRRRRPTVNSYPPDPPHE